MAEINVWTINRRPCRTGEVVETTLSAEREVNLIQTLWRCLAQTTFGSPFSDVGVLRYACRVGVL